METLVSKDANTSAENQTAPANSSTTLNSLNIE